MSTPEKSNIKSYLKNINFDMWADMTTPAADNQPLDKIYEWIHSMYMLITDPFSKSLQTPTEPFDFDSGVNVTEVADKMANLMYEKDGVGLSANQCYGLNYRILVLAAASEEKEESRMVMVNPKVVNTEGEDLLVEEQCLSWPGLSLKIKRPNFIRVRYTDEFGKTDTIKLRGFSARVVQHQIDILDGVQWWRRANRIHFDQAKRNLSKQKKIAKREQNRLQSVNASI